MWKWILIIITVVIASFGSSLLCEGISLLQIVKKEKLMTKRYSDYMSILNSLEKKAKKIINIGCVLLILFGIWILSLFLHY